MYWGSIAPPTPSLAGPSRSAQWSSLRTASRGGWPVSLMCSLTFGLWAPYPGCDGKTSCYIHVHHTVSLRSFQPLAGDARSRFYPTWNPFLSIIFSCKFQISFWKLRSWETNVSLLWVFLLVKTFPLGLEHSRCCFNEGRGRVTGKKYQKHRLAFPNIIMLILLVLHIYSFNTRR